MARIRTIKPKFWDDLKLSKISIESRLIFIAFWNFSDDNGIIIAENVWLKSKIFPHSDIKMKKFASWVLEMVEVSLIIPVIFQKNNYYLLPNFQKHQIINRPNYDDVFIPCEKLNELLKNSVNAHGIITDESMPYRKGKDRIGKEGMGVEGMPAGSFTPKTIKVAVFFKDSEIYDFEKFCKEFENTEYANFHLKFYYEAVKNWADGINAKKIDWAATARNFMLKDSRDSKAVLKGQDLLKNSNNGTNRNSKVASQYDDLEAGLEAIINAVPD